MEPIDVEEVAKFVYREFLTLSLPLANKLVPMGICVIE